MARQQTGTVVLDVEPDDPEQATPPAPTAQEDFNGRMVAVLEQLVANAPAQEIGYGHPKYQERLRNEGVFTEFAKPVFQNDKLAQARGLKPETIERAPQLETGTYLGGKVDVSVDQRGRVFLRYRNRTIEDRMAMQSLVRDFDDLIDRIWTEMHATAAA